MDETIRNQYVSTNGWGDKEEDEDEQGQVWNSLSFYAWSGTSLCQSEILRMDQENHDVPPTNPRVEQAYKKKSQTYDELRTNLPWFYVNSRDSDKDSSV